MNTTKGAKDMKHITASNKQELEALTKDYRNKGYMIITFSKKLIELENGAEVIVIEVK
jgi:hypothetical protein